MGLGKPEKIDKIETSRSYKRVLKWVARRKRRRDEKRFLDKAPKKNEYSGWSL